MDEFEGFSQEPSSLHKYLYCDQDPVNKFDPTGYMTMGEVLTVTRNISTLATRAIPNILRVSKIAGKFFKKRILRLVYDNRRWSTISRERWTKIGINAKEQGLSFEHLFIRQYWVKQFPWLQGFANSTVNSGLIIPQALNSSLGNIRWARMVFRLFVVTSAADAAVGGYMVGEKLSEEIYDRIFESDEGEDESDIKN